MITTIRSFSMCQGYPMHLELRFELSHLSRHKGQVCKFVGKNYISSKLRYKGKLLIMETMTKSQIIGEG